jgi:tetratricopeptide (TPR) repeat protein
MEKREFNRAIAYYRIGLDLTARPNIFHFNIGHALYFSRRYDEALASLRRALQGEEGISGAWLELGRTYYQLSDKSNTIYSWQSYLRAVPDNPQAATIRRAIELLSREDYLMPAERARMEQDRLAEEEARKQALRDRLAQALLEGERETAPMIFTERDLVTTVNDVETASKDKDDYSGEEDIEK